MRGMGVIGLLLVLALVGARYREFRKERELRERQRRAPIASRCTSDRVDVNRATRVELERVKGIGPVLAEEILRYRERHGPFRRLEELLILRGVGVRKMRALSEHLCIGEGQGEMRSDPGGN